MSIIYSGTCQIRNTKEPGKCVRLHKMSENSDFELHKFHCISIIYNWQYNDKFKIVGKKIVMYEKLCLSQTKSLILMY
jgi:hypothetical protein